MSHDLSQLREKQKLWQDVKTFPRPGQTWKHYKGGLYRVIDLVCQESDERICVVYNGIDKENQMPLNWSRTLESWMETVSLLGIPRFVLMSE